MKTLTKEQTQALLDLVDNICRSVGNSSILESDNEPINALVKHIVELSKALPDLDQRQRQSEAFDAAMDEFLESPIMQEKLDAENSVCTQEEIQAFAAMDEHYKTHIPKDNL
jgi:hypothetical protein